MFSKCARACVDGHVRGSRSADDLIQLPQFGKVASMAWSRDCSISVRRFVDTESHVASRRPVSVWLCKSYAGALAAAQMPMHSLVQPNTDTEDLSDAFFSCATRGWRHRGSFKLMTGLLNEVHLGPRLQQLDGLVLLSSVSTRLRNYHATASNDTYAKPTTTNGLDLLGRGII